MSVVVSTYLPMEEDAGLADDRAHLPDVARALFRELRACGYDAADIDAVATELALVARAYSPRDTSSRR